MSHVTNVRTIVRTPYNDKKTITAIAVREMSAESIAAAAPAIVVCLQQPIQTESTLRPRSQPPNRTPGDRFTNYLTTIL